jgi:hypothetical protein
VAAPITKSAENELGLSIGTGLQVVSGQLRATAIVESVVKVTGTSTGVVWEANWGQFDAAANRLEYTKKGNLHSLGGSLRRFTTAATLGSTTQIVSLAGNADYVPPPLTINVMSVSNINGHNVRVLVEPTGLVRIQKMPNSASWSWSINEFIPFFITWIG